MRTLLLILGFLITDPALTDPCKDHTVLNDTWRSADCKEKECSDKGMCDQQLDEGWYWFKSSGGWKILETWVTPGRCSTEYPGWLQGSHPTLEQREGSGTVCFNWDGNLCSWKREIKIKNCDGYFVYELKPTPGCEAAYCTDPGTAPTLGADDKSQPESTDSGSPIPTESPNSDPGTAPTLGADDKSQPESTDSGSPIPTESPNSGKSTTRDAGGKSTGKPTQQSSTVPVDSSTPGTKNYTAAIF
ncbi:pancreatic secretory granule membrane major glycoprotein GP2-like [Mustelus asterias]